MKLAISDFRQRIDYLVWMILFVIGCGIVYSVGKLTYSLWNSRTSRFQDVARSSIRPHAAGGLSEVPIRQRSQPCSYRPAGLMDAELTCARLAWIQGASTTGGP